MKAKDTGSNERTVAKNTFFLYLMTISSYVFPVFTFPYITRVLGAEKYGVVVLSNAVMQYFQMFFEFGFILSATSEISLSRDDRSRVAKITYGVILAKIILSVFGFAVLVVLCSFVDKFFEMRKFLFLSYVGIFLTVFLPDYLFRGMEWMGILTYRVILSRLVQLVLIFLLIRTGDDYMRYPVAAIGGNLLAVALTWMEVLKRLRVYPVRIPFKEAFAQLKRSSPFFISRVAVSMYQTLNTVLLGLRFPSAELARIT